MAQQTTPAHPAIMEAQLETTTTSEEAPIPTPIYTTKRLIVRALHPQDAQSLHENGDDPAVAKYMTLAFPSPYTLKSAQAWIAMNQIPRPTAFGICEASSPLVMIGGIGMTPGRDVSSHTAEIGYWVGVKHSGKGYMTEVLQGFTKWAFESWEGKDGQRLRRVHGRVSEGNTASMRCFEKSGFTKEGVMKGHVEKYGVTMDEHLFGLTKVDWEKWVATT